MTTVTAPNRRPPRRVRQTILRDRAARRQRRLASTLEVAFDPQLGLRSGRRSWPRVPNANRLAVAEPLQELVSLLRDPAITIPDDSLRRVLALATHPASPLYGHDTEQAQLAARSLVDELRAL